MEERTIEVCGVPDILSPDRTVDKLTIHFLRSKNGGGEVLRVYYPTSSKGQAFVVFELSEVANRVAGLKQSLEIGDQKFPLKIRIIDLSDVDLPVQATLDLGLFPNPSKVLQILEVHKFKVTKQGLSSRIFLLEGTFLNLRAVHDQLQKQLQDPGRPTQHHIRQNQPVTASDGITTGALPKNSTGTLPYINGSHHSHHAHTGDWPNTISSETLSARSLSVSTSPTSLDSFSVSSDQSVSAYYHSRGGRLSQNPGLLQDLESPQSLPVYSDNNLTTKPPLRGSLSTRETILSVDADVFRYTWSFRKDSADTILKSCGVECRPEENSGIICLTLKGRQCEKAKENLEYLFQKMELSLRTQKIPLSGCSHAKTAQMASQIQKLKDVYKVVVRQTDNYIEIIGTSADSYAVKQLVLGETTGLVASGRAGRSTERGPRPHRSLSVPKHQKIRSDQDSRTKLESSAGSHTYSAANYQDDNKYGGTTGVASRRQTSSESREKIESQRPVPRTQPEPTPPSSGHQMPSTKKYAVDLKAWTPTAIKNKISRKKN